jgi:hypothetical protein
VEIVKEEAERQRMQREELEVELQKVRQQMLAVPPSGKARRYMEDGMIDLADSSRFVWFTSITSYIYTYSYKINNYQLPLNLTLLQAPNRYAQ